MGKMIFVLGGARSGKSSWAESRACEIESSGARVIYLATCEHRPDDAEMSVRISSHKARRPLSWRTEEEAYEVEKPVASMSGGELMLVDCLSLWVSNLLLTAPDKDPAETVLERVDALMDAIKKSNGDVIIVSNETGCGVVPPSRLGRLYRDILGWANQKAARAADEVWLLVAGLPQRLK